MFAKKRFTIAALLLINLSAESVYAEVLSYSGRLVNANGSPVGRPVNLKAELAYSNAPSTILCSQDFTNVALANGVFHIKLELNCGIHTLTEVLRDVPPGEAAAIRIEDSSHAKVYSFQALHAVPQAVLSETSKQLLQLGAVDGQVLKWNGTSKKWEPGSGGGTGTVSNVSGTAPLSIINGATTPVISISQSSTSTDGFLSASDWNLFNSKQGTIAAGTVGQYYRGDKTWQTLQTSAVVENLNLYFTNQRVLDATLGGLLPSVVAITNGDSVIGAFSKAQGQIDSLASNANNFLIKNSLDTVTGQVVVDGATGALKIQYTPVNLDDATNVSYVQNYADTKLSKSGGTLTGDLLLNTAVKFKDSGANTATLKAPNSITASYVLTLPTSVGGNNQVLTTDASGNLSWTSPATSTPPSGAAGGDLSGTYPNPSLKNGVIADAHIATTLSQSKITNLTADLSAKQNVSSLPADVRAILLTGFSTASSAVVTAADSILSAFGKLQAQLSSQATSLTSKADQTNVTQTITAASITGLSAPVAGTDATNKTYVDTQIAGASNQWSINGANV